LPGSRATRSRYGSHASAAIRLTLKNCYAEVGVATVSLGAAIRNLIVARTVRTTNEGHKHDALRGDDVPSLLPTRARHVHPYAFDEQVIDGIRIHARRGVDLDRVRGEVEVAY